MALIINTGTPKRDALQLAHDLLAKFPLSLLPKVENAEFFKFSGLGTSKIARLQAVLELGRRTFHGPDLSSITIATVEDVVRESLEIVNKPQEHLLGLYLNVRNELVKKEIIGIGSLNMNVIHPRDVFAPALGLPCSGMIVVHNHPSGNCQPSQSDVEFTHRIIQAAEILGYTLFDHIIVSRESFYSFHREHGLF